jgi:hypothetical protein
VIPGGLTHGRAAQRQQWFEQGFQKGSLAGCDTFGAGAR